MLYDQVGAGGEICGQWLGTHGAVYQLMNLPLLTEENIAPLFDLTDKQRGASTIKQAPLPDNINFNDTEEGETLLDREKLTLSYGGCCIRPYITRGGLEFVDTDYFAPLADVAGTLEIYERHTATGGTYFVAKNGLMVVAVIMPLSIIEEGFVHYLNMLADKCSEALAINQQQERAKADNDDEQHEQTTL